MNAIVTLLLVFPAVFFLSLLFEGFDRKIYARLQKRIGPSIIQPFYDFFKLVNKEHIIPVTASRKIFQFVPIIAAIVSFLSAAILITNIIEGLPIAGDLLLIMYLLMMVSVLLMIGGSSSGNPYGGISFSRKMTLLLGYEVPMILSLVSLAFTPGFSLTYFDIVSTQIRLRSMLAFTYPSKVIATISFLLCIPAAAEVIPFDMAEAKSEIVSGYLIEYGGMSLALIKLANASMKFTLTFLATTLFFYTPALFEGHITLGLGGTIIMCLVTTLMLMICVITIPRTIFARLKIGQAFKFYWGISLLLSILSVMLSIFGF